MRLLQTILLLICVGCSSIRDTAALDLSSEDRAQIASLIKSETDEPIQMIGPDSEIRGAVLVGTGFSSEAFNSSGKAFTLKKTKKGWIIIGRGSWNS